MLVSQKLYELNSLLGFTGSRVECCFPILPKSITHGHAVPEQSYAISGIDKLERDMTQKVSYSRGKRCIAHTPGQLSPPFTAPLLNHLHRGNFPHEIQHRQSIQVRQRPSRQVQQPRSVRRIPRQCPREMHQRERKHVFLFLVHLPRLVLDMRPYLEMVRRQGHKVVVVWVNHDVAPQVDELDKVFLPRFGPLVGAHPRDDRATDGEGGLGEAKREVVVELAPGRGKVECTPATWNLREVGGGGGSRSEERARAEGLPASGTELEDFLLVKADPEELRGRGAGISVSNEHVRMHDRPDEYEQTCNARGSFWPMRKREETIQCRLRVTNHKSHCSLGTTTQRQRGVSLRE